MTRHRATYALPALLMASYVAAIVLNLIGGDWRAADAGYLVFSVIGAGVFVVVGTAIVRAQPGNPLGWLFQAFGVVFGGGAICEALAARGAPGSRLASLGAWYDNWNWAPLILGTATLVLLLYPDGRLPDSRRRWRLALWCAVLATLLMTVHAALIPGPLDSSPELLNPFPVPAIRWAPLFLALLIPTSVLSGVAAIVVRRRRASGIVRLQLRWLFFSGSLLAIPFLSYWPVTFFGETAVGVLEVLLIVALVAVPVTVGLAILRYRLYDIDVIVNRTLVYGALTALLAAAYGGLTVLGQALVPANSELSVAVATLAIAALVRPVRRRIQDVVDRRFYRARYDAAAAVEDFQHRLRQEVDLDAVTADLLGVVGRTVQPASATLWLR